MAERKSTKRAHNFKDIAGQRFGRLTAVSLETGGKDCRWICRCDCGVLKSIRASHVSSGKVTSCGCKRRENSHSTTHGMSGTREYLAWGNAKTRCFNKTYKTYPHYGGRGITMSKEWADSFEQFMADMGPCPKGMSLERKDVNGNYCKENCKWATHLEQMHNQRKNIKVTYNGETLPLWEWSERSGIPQKILNGRYQRGTNILGPRTRRWKKRPKD